MARSRCGRRGSPTNNERPVHHCRGRASRDETRIRSPPDFAPSPTLALRAREREDRWRDRADKCLLRHFSSITRGINIVTLALRIRRSSAGEYQSVTLNVSLDL